MALDLDVVRDILSSSKPRGREGILAGRHDRGNRTQQHRPLCARSLIYCGLTSSMHLRTGIVSLLALGLLAWFLRGTNFGDVWQHVQGVRADLLLASLLAIGVMFIVRAIRWRYLLAPLATTKFRTVFRCTVIGFGALALLPIRVGDVIRPYLLARQEGLPVTSVFATVVMERVLDLIAVLALLAVYVWGFAGEADLPPRLLKPIEVSASIAAAIAAMLLATMWVLATHPERIGALAAALARVLPGKLSERVGRLASTFSSGFAAARSIRELLLALVWSFVLWLAIAAQAWTVTIAFGIPMSFPGTFLLQSMLVIGVAVPTPGGVGSFHEAYRLGVTTFFGASSDQAVAAALVTHAISFIPPVLGGILFMTQDGLSFGRLEAMASSARDKEGPAVNEVPILRSSRR
jgi:glycosyltransferase 2 family protein